MLPDTDGFAICRGMRADRSLAAIPVIMLTARAEEADRVRAWSSARMTTCEAFSPKELAARVKAVLRRASPETGRSRIEVADGLLIDTNTLEASLHGQKLQLTQAEFRILHLLATRIGWVFSREKILDHLWGDEKNVTDRSVDVHVKHLRDKLGPSGKMIVNVRGVGYKLADRDRGSGPRNENEQTDTPAGICRLCRGEPARGACLRSLFRARRARISYDSLTQAWRARRARLWFPFCRS